MRIEIRARDGLARGGTLVHDDLRLPSPCAADTAALFPSLALRAHENVPLAAGETFVRAWLVPGPEPHAVHPASEETVPAGTALLVANWHTALADPAAYVRFLVALKERLPPDAPWYAPAAALPSNAALLAWTGFDLFDYTGPDLASARGRFLMPEGELSADALGSGLCSCPGCAAGNLARHNRLALDAELALVRRFVQDGRLRDLIDAPLPSRRGPGRRHAPPRPALRVRRALGPRDGADADARKLVRGARPARGAPLRRARA
jgi:archaeosine synthase